MKQLITLIFACACSLVSAQQDRSQVQSYPPMASRGVYLGAIPALRDLTPRTDYVTVKPGKLFEKRNYFYGNEHKNPHPQPQNGDPLVPKFNTSDRDGDPEIIPGFNFEGLRDPSGVFPPDPSGDIGKNHYVQTVNSSGGSWLQVWDKVTGNSVYGPVLTSTIWSQVGANSAGDPIIVYDHDAERWVLMELLGFAANELLIAISDDSDPTGGWKAYRMQTFGFPDYPKLYVWHNAYFITVNEIAGGNICSGYAIDRNDLLAGEEAFDLYRFVMPNFLAIQFQPATGADWEGGPPPPPGSPGYIFRIYDDAWDGGQDHLETWEVFLDWNNPALSHIDGPALLFPAPFETRVCFGPVFTWDCIEQPGADAPKIAALENTIMHRAPYRNFGTHESVVMNHITDVSGITGNGGDAEVRWYELRKSGAGDWTLHQQGTYAPDLETNRFMGTISMDEAGNIGLGYSGCSENLFPGLYITGQRNNDPPGEMTLAEHTLATGGASHTSSRWGDYSSMTVDPYDGRTFWFTGEYQPDANATWGTRIGSFKVQRDTYDIKPVSLTAPVPSPFLGNTESVTVRIGNGGLVPASNYSVSLFFEGNLVVTDNVSASVAEGAAYEHTFSQTVAMPVPGKDYRFRVVTKWGKDQFVRNDTLDEIVQKRTSNDAALAGTYNLPGTVCGTETDFSLVLRNAAAVPMQSAVIQWRLNQQNWNVYNWTGNLAPGARDTVLLQASGIVEGVNLLRAYTILPNNIADEKSNNDSLTVKFYGNIEGTYLTAESQTNTGSMQWELRTLTDDVLASGKVNAQQTFAQICSDDSECYRIAFRSDFFTWNGDFSLKDIFGNELIRIDFVGVEEEVFTFCTPERQQIDVGAMALVAPVSGQGLGTAEAVTVQLRNFGLTQQSGIQVSYRMDGGPWNTENLPGIVGPGQTVTHTFATTENLGTLGATYHFDLRATVAGDALTVNDTTSANVTKRYLRELELLGIDIGTACADSTFAIINLLVRNNGLGNEHTFDVAHTLNGVPQPVIPFNFLFADPDATNEVPLYITGLKTGNNDLSITLVNIDNAGADELPANNTGTASFTIDPGNAAANLVFSPGSEPEEITWELLDDAGVIVASGGPFIAPFGFIIDDVCLKRDSCYTLRIRDTGGDGMPGGYVALSIGGFTIFEYSGDNFGTEKLIPFCATAFCADMVLGANVTPASGSGIPDGIIEAEPLGGNPPYFFILNDGNLQESPVFENLPPGQYTLICIDALGCSREITLNIGAVSTQEPNAVRTFEISPNPTAGIAHVTISALGEDKNVACEVFDGNGKKTQTARMQRWDDSFHANIALDKFPAGGYYVRVMGLERMYVRRIVKK